MGVPPVKTTLELAMTTSGDPTLPDHTAWNAKRSPNFPTQDEARRRLLKARIRLVNWVSVAALIGILVYLITGT